MLKTRDNAFVPPILRIHFFNLFRDFLVSWYRKEREKYLLCFKKCRDFKTKQLRKASHVFSPAFNQYQVIH